MTKQTENSCYTDELGLDAHKWYKNIDNLFLVLLIWVNIFPSLHENRLRSQNIHSNPYIPHQWLVQVSRDTSF